MNSWKCQSCGETLEPQFDACWNCGASRELPSDAQTETLEGCEDEPMDPESMLNQILILQKEQQIALREIKFKVGCLFAYMFVGLVFGVLAAVAAFMR